MRLVANLVGLRAGGGATIGRRLLPALAAARSDWKVQALVHEPCAAPDDACPPNLNQTRIPVLSSLERVRFDRRELPEFCRRHEATAVLNLANIGSQRRIDCPQVTYLQNAYLVYPHEYFARHGFPLSPWKGFGLKYRFLRYRLASSLAHTDHLVVQTGTMKEMTERTLRPRCGVSVIGNTFHDTASVDQAPPEQLEPMVRARGRFRLLYLACPWRHKNLSRSCEAVHRARRNGTDVVLFVTLAPAQSEEGDRLIARIDGGEFGDSVVNLGAVPVDDVPAAYQLCDGVLMMSLLESFSANYLEALAHRLPLLVSDRPFATEICGPTALYRDPLDTGAISDGVTRIAQDAALRAELTAGAQQRSAEFVRSWDSVALEFWGAVDVALQHRRG